MQKDLDHKHVFFSYSVLRDLIQRLEAILIYCPFPCDQIGEGVRSDQRLQIPIYSVVCYCTLKLLGLLTGCQKGNKTKFELLQRHHGWLVSHLLW